MLINNKLILVTLLSLSLFSCGHSHTYLDTYEYDDIYCWKVCQGCKEIANKEEHSFVANDDYYVCSRCNYKKDFMAKFTNLEGEKFQVAEAAINYINDGGAHRIYKFSKDSNLDDSYSPITINWTLDKNLTKLTFSYGLKEDLSDAITYELEINKTSINLYNLLPGKTYYIKLTESNNKGTNEIKGSFITSNKGPRVMYVDGVPNFRDIGGYTTSSGKKVKTNMIFRSGQLEKSPTSSFNVHISEDGKKFLSEELKIKHEIDFRVKEEGYPSESLIPNATLLYKVTDGYKLEQFKNVYKEIFTLLADINNYPFIFHCEGGADRTGTFAFLLESLLNLENIDIYRDYEFTSFSMYGKNDNYRSTIQGGYANYWKQLNDEFGKLKGSNKQDKAKTFLLECGLSEEQINNIITIMLE